MATLFCDMPGWAQRGGAAIGSGGGFTGSNPSGIDWGMMWIILMCLPGVAYLAWTYWNERRNKKTHVTIGRDDET